MSDALAVDGPAELTIGDVAERTGITIPTLRSWEARFGFPAPRRQAGGHRRYAASQVAALDRVMAERRSGVALPVAIEMVLREPPQAEPSIFAALRLSMDGLPVQVVGEKSMLAMSRAIEDECYAQGGHHVVFGAFQQERFYRRAAHRWRELGRTGAYGAVFADFRVPRLDASPAEIPLPGRSVVRREWVVLCLSPTYSAGVAAWERPGGAHSGPRRFEAVWTVDRTALRAASRACVEQVRLAAPELALWMQDAIGALPRAGDDPVRSVTSVANRAIAYLDQV